MISVDVADVELYQVDVVDVEHDVVGRSIKLVISPRLLWEAASLRLRDMEGKQELVHKKSTWWTFLLLHFSYFFASLCFGGVLNVVQEVEREPGDPIITSGFLFLPSLASPLRIAQIFTRFSLLCLSLFLKVCQAACDCISTTFKALCMPKFPIGWMQIYPTRDVKFRVSTFFFSERPRKAEKYTLSGWRQPHNHLWFPLQCSALFCLGSSLLLLMFSPNMVHQFPPKIGRQMMFLGLDNLGSS